LGILWRKDFVNR